MDFPIVLVLLAVTALTSAVAGHALGARRKSRPAAPVMFQTRSPQFSRLRLEAEAKRRRRNQIGRNLQVALIQIEKAPDFQRAASWAKQCTELPVAFRQRQFRRFRKELMNHLGQRIRAGDHVEPLMAGLRELVTGLGLAAFEADYILADVRRLQQPAGGTDEFESQLRRQQEEHARRMDVLRGLTGLDQDVKEQLVEAEERRFQDQLFGQRATT